MAAVARWNHSYQHQTDELVSEMLNALVDGVKRISEGALDSHIGTPGIAPYLSTTIHGRLNKMLRRKRPVLSFKDERIKSELDRAIGRKGSEDQEDLIELINRSVTTDQERLVINLRVEGYDDSEIAKMMKLTKARVHQIRTNVKHRILEQLA